MIRRLILALVALSMLVPTLAAQSVPTPRDHFGFDMGEDRKLANWDQLTAYYEILAERSPQALREAIEGLWASRPDRGRTRHHAERFDWAETTRQQAALLHGLCAQQTSSTFNLNGECSTFRAPGPVAGPVPLEKAAD